MACPQMAAATLQGLQDAPGTGARGERRGHCSPAGQGHGLALQRLIRQHRVSSARLDPGSQQIEEGWRGAGNFCSSAAPGAFTLLCDQPLHLISKRFSPCPQTDPAPMSPPSSQPLATTKLLPVSTALPIPAAAYQRHHTLCGLPTGFSDSAQSLEGSPVMSLASVRFSYLWLNDSPW